MNHRKYAGLFHMGPPLYSSCVCCLIRPGFTLYSFSNEPCLHSNLKKGGTSKYSNVEIRAGRRTIYATEPMSVLQ